MSNFPSLTNARITENMTKNVAFGRFSLEYFILPQILSRNGGKTIKLKPFYRHRGDLGDSALRSWDILPSLHGKGPLHVHNGSVPHTHTRSKDFGG